MSPSTLTRAALVALLGLCLGGCYQVLSGEQGDTDDLFMKNDGAVAVAPEALALEAVAGQQATATLTWTETSTTAGIEMELAVQGEGAEVVTIHPGQWSVTVVPSGALQMTVTYTATAGDPDRTLELVATTTGTPAEVRVPITTHVLPAGDPT